MEPVGVDVRKEVGGNRRGLQQQRDWRVLTVQKTGGGEMASCCQESPSHFMLLSLESRRWFADPCCPRLPHEPPGRDRRVPVDILVSCRAGKHIHGRGRVGCRYGVLSPVSVRTGHRTQERTRE